MRKIKLVFWGLVISFVAIMTEYWTSVYLKSSEDYRIAEARIAEQIENGSGVLKLSDLHNLRALPEKMLEHPKWLYIYLDETRISNISILANFQDIKLLDLFESAVADISPLANNNSITDLQLSHTKVFDISTVATMQSLQRLGLARTSIKSLEPATRAPRLKWLNLYNSHAHDGSKKYYDQLNDDIWTDVYNGTPYKQNYVPGGLYKFMVGVKSLWDTTEIALAFKRLGIA